ncbi:DUF805 domain-containing protein [Gemmobacter sp.]|uniref:DUF805 domain-containing protein n=1 Tax=Gemmobacter sp. TaxID=1898957 RepID=UPI002AFE4574|nr:DUF805 domain-containing protein [Gemmobacter sp.]
MNMIEAVKVCFSKYVTFSGRARRAEYWWFILFTTIVSFVLQLLDGSFSGEPGIISGVWGLATFLPSLAAASRRLHDIDRTAWWLLIILVPLIGWIVLIVFFATPGTRGPNRFGADPITGNRADVFN